MKSRMPLSVEILRGQTVESHHHVMAVVLDEKGETVAEWGPSDFLTFPRSAIKMLQALPLIETGTAEAYNLQDHHLCLACASHRGEKQHIAGVHEFMKKTGVKESQLACGPHMPYDEATANEMIRQSLKPSAIVNNCSGKHTGMIATSLHLRENPEGYENYDHACQVRVRKVLSDAMGMDVDKSPYGVDGCGIPTYAIPLKNLAKGMASLLSHDQHADRRYASRRLIEAVQREPFYISGTDDFNTEAIAKTEGRCVIKGGAEGVYCGVIPTMGLAFALKAEDGSARASQSATGYLLKKLGVFQPNELESLKKYMNPRVKNWKGLDVGQIRVSMPD